MEEIFYLYRDVELNEKKKKKMKRCTSIQRRRRLFWKNSRNRNFVIKKRLFSYLKSRVYYTKWTCATKTNERSATNQFGYYWFVAVRLLYSLCNPVRFSLQKYICTKSHIIGLREGNGRIRSGILSQYTIVSAVFGFSESYWSSPNKLTHRDQYRPAQCRRTRNSESIQDVYRTDVDLRFRHVRLEKWSPNGTIKNRQDNHLSETRRTCLRSKRSTPI